MVKLGVAYAKGQTVVKILGQTKVPNNDYDYLGRFIEDGSVFFENGKISMDDIANNFSREFRVSATIKEFKLARNGFDFLEIVPQRKRKKKSFKQLRFRFS